MARNAIHIGTSGWHRPRRDVYVYFDNDQKSAAPTDAAALRAMVGS